GRKSSSESAVISVEDSARTGTPTTNGLWITVLRRRSERSKSSSRNRNSSTRSALFPSRNSRRRDRLADQDLALRRRTERPPAKITVPLDHREPGVRDQRLELRREELAL